jgi:hypothetical protein
MDSLLVQNGIIDVVSDTAAAVANTSLLCDLHFLKLLGDELCFLETALRLLDPSSSSSMMINFCLQVSILRFMVAGRILKKNNRKRATQSLEKDKTKSRNEAARGRNMKLKTEDETFTIPVVVYCTVRLIDPLMID